MGKYVSVRMRVGGGWGVETLLCRYIVGNKLALFFFVFFKIENGRKRQIDKAATPKGLQRAVIQGFCRVQMDE